MWKAGKWETVPEFHDALRQHITYALVSIRRDHWVAHMILQGPGKAVEPNGVDIQRHVCVPESASFHLFSAFHALILLCSFR